MLSLYDNNCFVIQALRAEIGRFEQALCWEVIVVYPTGLLQVVNKFGQADNNL